MTAQPSEPKLTKSYVEFIRQQLQRGSLPQQRSFVEQLCKEWLEQYKALTRAAMWLDNDIDWQNPNPNEVKLLEMLRSVLP